MKGTRMVEGRECLWVNLTAACLVESLGATAVASRADSSVNSMAGRLVLRWETSLAAEMELPAVLEWVA